MNQSELDEVKLKEAMLKHSKIQYRIKEGESFKDTCFRQGYLAGLEEARNELEKYFHFALAEGDSVGYGRGWADGHQAALGYSK